jgi:hypothetical protein
VEIEIRAGFRAPDGELLALLNRPDWQRMSFQRRGEIVREMVRVCDELERPCVEAWRRNAQGAAQHVIGYWRADRERGAGRQAPIA